MRIEDIGGGLTIPGDQLDLQAALNSLGIPCTVVERSEGPRTISYRLMPTTGVTSSNVVRRAVDLGVRLDVPSCAARVEMGRLYVEVTRTDPDIPRRLEMKEPADPYEAIAGVGVGGVPVTFDLRSLPHLIVAGTSGSGKSVALRNIVRSVSRIPGALVMVFDAKGGGDFAPSTDTPATVHVVQTREHISCWAGLAEREMLRRQGVIKTAKNISVADGAPVVLVFDEIQTVIKDPMLSGSLFAILSMGRSSGIHCVIATQAPSAKVLGGNEMRVNAPSRLVLRTATASDSRVALTETGAEKLLGTGDAILRYAGRSVRIQVPSLDVEEMYHGI